MSRSDRGRRWGAVLLLAVCVLAAGLRAGPAQPHVGSGPAITITTAASTTALASEGGRARHVWLCAATAIAIGATGGVVPPLGTAIAVSLVPFLISVCI